VYILTILFFDYEEYKKLLQPIVLACQHHTEADPSDRGGTNLREHWSRQQEELETIPEGFRRTGTKIFNRLVYGNAIVWNVARDLERALRAATARDFEALGYQLDHLLNPSKWEVPHETATDTLVSRALDRALWVYGHFYQTKETT
jgi:hypothetical protein